MKKFYFLLVAMMVSIAANAIDYYLIGGFNGWSLKQANCKFTDQGDGTYVLDFNGTLTPGFKINDGTWSNSNANFGGNGNLTVGQVYNLTVGGSSGNIGLAANIDNPHIVFNPTAKTLLITGQETEAELIYGLWGAFTSGTWSAVDLTEADGKWTASDVEVTYASAQFGIKEMDKATGSQTNWISAAGDNVIKEAGTFDLMIEGTNFSIATGTWSFVFDPEAMTLTVSGEGSGEDPDPVVDYTGWYLNVQGEFNNYQPSGVAFNADGTAVATELPIGTSVFELKIWNGSADSYLSNGKVLVPGETYSITGSSSTKMTIEGATEDEEYDVYYDAVNKTIRVEKSNSGDDPEIDYTTWYLNVFGPFNGWTNNGVAFSADGIGVHESLPIGDSVFQVKIWNGKSDVVMGTDEVVELDTPTLLKKNTGYEMKIANAVEGDIYNVTYDAVNCMLTVTKDPSSISVVEAENNVPAVYYNLQGMEVANPVNGLYIEKRGDKVRKVVIR
ncbi:MAG: hypothetical protein K2M79_05815 [Muribaculaceae bacterium]|nr:hypothetical protein [Muribaculaceae bacterium]